MSRMRVALSGPAAKLWRAGALAAMLALLPGCRSGDPVKVMNGSATALTDVVIAGNGFTEKVGTIPPGGAETVRIQPTRGSETGLRITFEANGRRYSSSRDALEDDHLDRAEITVNADYSIQIDFNP